MDLAERILQLTPENVVGILSFALLLVCLFLINAQLSQNFKDLGEPEAAKSFDKATESLTLISGLSGFVDNMWFYCFLAAMVYVGYRIILHFMPVYGT